MIDVQAVSKVGSDGELGHSHWQSVPPWVIPLTSAGVPAAEGDSPRTRGILPVQYQWLSLHSAGGGMVKEAAILGFLFSLKVFILVFSRLRHASIHGSGCQMPLELLKEYLSTFLSSPHCILKKPQNKKPQKKPNKKPAASLLFQCNLCHEEIRQACQCDCQREETNCGSACERVLGTLRQGHWRVSFRLLECFFGGFCLTGFFVCLFGVFLMD